MSNEARYERLRAEVRQLQGLMRRVMQHVGLEVPEEQAAERPPRRFVEGGRQTNANQFGGGASMRNSPRITRAGQQQGGRGSGGLPSARKLGSSVSSDGTRTTVRQVSPGVPVVTAAEATAAPPVAALGTTVPAAAAASGLDLQQLLSSAASVAEALGAALVQFGVGSAAAASAEPAEGEQEDSDPNAWMAAEGVEAGPVVEQQ